MRVFFIGERNGKPERERRRCGLSATGAGTVNRKLANL
jgi:hypothetical protein